MIFPPSSTVPNLRAVPPKSNPAYILFPGLFIKNADAFFLLQKTKIPCFSQVASPFFPKGEPISLHLLHHISSAVLQYSFMKHLLASAAISARK
jgi:hypothetical protein